jgi:nucleotide-binding universal stress UspA family protein
MNFGKKVLIAVDMTETTKSQLRELKKLEFLKGSDIHFVHVFQTTIATYGYGEFCQMYPVEPNRKEIENSLISSMTQMSDGALEAGTKITYRCLFDENPKEEFCLYAKEVGADTIIIFTRQKHGIFESSFAQYCARHSPCHVLVLKA